MNTHVPMPTAVKHQLNTCGWVWWWWGWLWRRECSAANQPLMREESVHRDQASCIGYKIDGGQYASDEAVHYHLINHTNHCPHAQLTHVHFSLHYFLLQCAKSYPNAMKSLLSGTIMRSPWYWTFIHQNSCLLTLLSRIFLRLFRAWEFLILPFHFFAILLVSLADFPCNKYVDLS